MIVDILLVAMMVYLIAGVLFSIYFYLKGASKIDNGTEGTPWHFKLIIFPGVILMWSVLFIKLIRKNDA